jgi:hypothetical protein
MQFESPTFEGLNSNNFFGVVSRALEKSPHGVLSIPSCRVNGKRLHFGQFGARDGFVSLSFAFAFGFGNAFTLAFQYHLAFKRRTGAEHRQHQLASGRRGVEGA